jgi:arylsulfatase A-like enzyme
MALFDHAGNPALRKRVTLADETRDAFVLFPGEELVDKKSVAPGSRLTLAVNKLQWFSKAIQPGYKLTLSLTSASATRSFSLDPNRRAWQEREFSLDDFAGQSVTFRIQLELLATPESGRPSFALVIANPTLAEPRPEDRLNLILLNIDTLRPSHLGRFGYPRDTSPFLDRFAQECVLFEQTESQASWTPPSVGTLFTSLYPPQHGSLGKDRIPLPEANLTLAEILRQAGYRTAAFSASPFITPDYGFGQGFEVFGFEKIEHAPALNARVLPWLEEHGSEPFFLYIMYFDPHHHYQPLPPFDRKFQNGPDGKPLWNPERFRDHPPRVMKLDQRVDRETFEYLRSEYDGEIGVVDQALEELIEKLRETGRLDHSVLVITSDHGEEFLDHGRFGHGRTLYEEVLRVLLLVRTPSLPRPGLRVPRLARVLDIMPTALDLLGVPAPANLEGKSLVPWLKDANAEGDREAFASMQHMFEAGRTARSLRRGGRKLILTTNPDAVELYDLDQDPGETHNLAPAAPEVVRELTTRVTALEHQMQGSAVGTPLNPPDAETLKLLQSLGYLD